MREIKKSRSRGPQEKVKPFPGVGGSPQTIGSRDATLYISDDIELQNLMFQSPNYRVTRCNWSLLKPASGRISFSPQTIGSRDATWETTENNIRLQQKFQSPNYRVTRCNRKSMEIFPVSSVFGVSVPQLSGHAMQPESCWIWKGARQSKFQSPN